MKKSNLKTADNIFLIALVIVASTIILYAADFCFFWDTVSIVSKQAHYLYENKFSDYLYPVAFDNADPQLLQSYIAMIWVIFGKSIQAAHLAMIPFMMGIIVFAFLISKKIFGDKLAYLATILLLAESSIITQCIIMSPDVLLILFALMSIYGIIERKTLLTTIALLLLTLVNRRAMMIGAGFMLSQIIIDLFIRKTPFNKELIKKYFLLFTPACIAVLAYLWVRYHFFGWFFSHPDSPWYTTSQTVNMYGFIKNGLTIGRAFVDFGKLIWWILLFVVIIKFGLKKIFTEKTKELWIIFISILIILLPATLLIQNQFGGRYFIPHYFVIGLIVISLVSQHLNNKAKRLSFALIFLILFSGNLWIYPDNISQSWDCSLAHLPYYKLREDVKSYFKNEKINFSDVGFGYPNTATIKFIEANENKHQFANIEPGENTYIVYSNIQNLDDETTFLIKKHYSLVRSFKSLGVFMDIYKIKKQL